MIGENIRIYQLEHEYWQDGCEPSGFRIGFYTSMEKALAVKKQYMSLPGFIDHAEGFRIRHHIINSNSAKSVWVVDLGFDDYFDEHILIGVFESNEVANKYIEFYTSLCGRDTKQGFFNIDEYQLDKSFWQEGFVTV